MKTNNDDWITIKPNGEENKGRHLLIKEGETPKEAIKRTWGVDLDKKKSTKEQDIERFKQGEIKGYELREKHPEITVDELDKIQKEAGAIRKVNYNGEKKSLQELVEKEGYRTLKQHTQHVIYKGNIYYRITPNEYDALKNLSRKLNTTSKSRYTIKKAEEYGEGQYGLYKDGKLITHSDDIFKLKQAQARDAETKQPAETAEPEKQTSPRDEWQKKADENNKTSPYKQSVIDVAIGEVQPTINKTQLKREGLSGKEISELSAEGDILRKQIADNVRNSDKSESEKLDFLESIKDRADALNKKMQDYIDKAHNKKEAKETSIKTAKDFEIVKETPKAYLIKKNGRQAWIQKRWVKDDGTLSPAGEQSLSRGEKVEDIERENAERDKGLELPKADWESEKAYGFDIDISIENPSDPDGESRKTRHRIFIPKSMVKEGRIPAWLIEKKLDDAKYQYFSERGGYTTGIGSIGSVFGKDTYLEGGHERIAFTKEKADYEKHKNDYLLDVNNHVIRFGNALLCKVQNKFLCIYNDKWITVKPNGEENKGRHLLLEGDESPREAMERKWHISEKKNKQVNPKGQPESGFTEARQKSDSIYTKYKQSKDDYSKAWDEFAKAMESDDYKETLRLRVQAKEKKQNYQQAYAEGINEISKAMKSTLASYSKNTNELVKQIDTIPDRIAEAKQKYSDLQEQDVQLFRDYKNGTLSISFDELRYKTKKIGEELIVARRNVEKAKQTQIEENIKAINKRDTNFKLTYETTSPAMKPICDKLSEALGGFIGNGLVTETVKVNKLRKNGRANYANGAINVTTDDDLGTAIHEYMHFVEEQNPRVLMNSVAFLKMRTDGEKMQSLVKLTGNSGYRGEYAKPDKFFSPYCGKLYTDSEGHIDATEIMSMGLQRIVTEPKKFAQEDREYFDFVIANIKGDI